MRTSESTAAIGEAMSIAIAGMENPAKTEMAKVKTKTGADYSYRYASLPDILDAARPILGTSGLSLTLEAVTEVPLVGSRALMLHTSGEWIEYGPLMLPAGPDAQTAGSALTYSRRYLVCSILGIAADEDDDGAAASKKTTAKKPKEDWGTKVEAPKTSGEASGSARSYGEGESSDTPSTSSESQSPGDAGEGEGNGTPSSSPGDDEPAPDWLWKEATAVKLTGPRALKLARTAVDGGFLPGPLPTKAFEITTAQLTALIEKNGEKT